VTRVVCLHTRNEECLRPAQTGKTGSPSTTPVRLHATSWRIMSGQVWALQGCHTICTNVRLEINETSSQPHLTTILVYTQERNFIFIKRNYWLVPYCNPPSSPFINVSKKIRYLWCSKLLMFYYKVTRTPSCVGGAAGYAQRAHLLPHTGLFNCLDGSARQTC